MSVLLNPEFVKIEDVVPCVAHTPKDGHKTIDVVDPKTRTTVKRCDKYPSISCDVHNAFNGVSLPHSGTPSSFICGPDGAPIAKPDDGNWHNAVGTIAKKLQDAQQKLGRPLPRALYDKVVRDLAQADQDLADGKYDKAVKSVQKYAEDKKLPASLRDGRVKEKLGTIDAKGVELVEEAKSKRESAPEDALKLAKKVQKEFKGLSASEKAGELVKEWEGGAAAPGDGKKGS